MRSILSTYREQLRQEDALDGVGYTEEDIDALVQQLRDEEDVDKDLDDDGPEDPPEAAVAELGDLWALGEHRLLCGDSTSLDDVRRVMADDKAALVATDPPYLVDYTGERPNDSGIPGTSWRRYPSTCAGWEPWGILSGVLRTDSDSVIVRHEAELVVCHVGPSVVGSRW